jgi:predicted  nucleic acid-binding Zn-ribbon protein
MALRASPNDQARLLDLQGIDIRLSQLDHRMRTLPQIAAITALTADADRLRRERTAERGRVDDVRAELTRTESDGALVATRIGRDVGRLQGSSSVKDVAGLESELVGLRRRQAELEEIELGLMETLETLEDGMRITEAERNDILARITGLAAERDQDLAALSVERDQAVADRATIVAGLPADLVALYERQRERYGYGASLLQGGVSSASGVRLLENEIAIVRAADPETVLLCPDSQAILVRTAESGI